MSKYKLEIWHNGTLTGRIVLEAMEDLGDAIQALSPTILKDGVRIEVTVNE